MAESLNHNTALQDRKSAGLIWGEGSLVSVSISLAGPRAGTLLLHSLGAAFPGVSAPVPAWGVSAVWGQERGCPPRISPDPCGAADAEIKHCLQTASWGVICEHRAAAKPEKQP